MQFAKIKGYFKDPPDRITGDLLELAHAVAEDLKSLDISARMISGLVDSNEQKKAFDVISNVGNWAAYGFYKKVSYCRPEWLIAHVKRTRTFAIVDANILASVPRAGLWTEDDLKIVLAQHMKPVKENNQFKISQFMEFLYQLKLANPDVKADMFQSFIENQYINLSDHIDRDSIFEPGIKLLTVYDDWNHETWQKYLHKEKLFDLEAYCYPDSSFDEDAYMDLLDKRNIILADVRAFIDNVENSNVFHDKVNGNMVTSFIDSSEYTELMDILTRLKLNRRDISKMRNVPTEYLARHYEQIVKENISLGEYVTILFPSNKEKYIDRGNHYFIQGEIDIHGSKAADALRPYYDNSATLSTLWILRFSFTKEEVDRIGWSPATMDDSGLDVFKKIYDAMDWDRRNIYPSGWDDLSAARIMLELAKMTLLHKHADGSLFRLDNFLSDHGLKICAFKELHREILVLAATWMMNMNSEQKKLSSDNVIIQERVNSTIKLLKKIMPDVFQSSRSSEKESSLKLVDMVFSKSAKNFMTLFHLIDVKSMSIIQQMDVISKVFNDIEHPGLSCISGKIPYAAPQNTTISFDHVGDNF